ncbi:membrane-associated lipoprotein involved in thiamine biosynthesis [Spongiibacter sp. IMCC21906]|uniref:FAD:protein FMN transferase n=1 Tax=Spongiibacter sp. IMCC21906 TaxID=1620392 RepID=UPI00062DDE38|nr:FAD:protein FMN transferase [Spongiibacter sp. IMCC21906]AKH69718.1 membrane-associated lipoprotein involved in thiamine biosynthesis [Spongiibacter sp. IMCC21906]
MLRIPKAALVLLLLFLVGCNPDPEAVILLSGNTMGTTYHITLVNPGELRSDELKKDLDFQLEHFNSIASTYIEDSELNKLNRSKVGEWQKVSPPLYAMLNIATEVSWLSGGAFDITVGPLVNLWGFGPDKAHGVPADDAIAAALKNVGYTQLEMDMLEPKVLRRAAVQLDLSAVAKGYGVDAAAVWLESLGVTNYLVEIGGEMRVAGKSPRGDAWRVGVENPDPNATETLPIRLAEIAVATSGDYRNYFEEDGVRYSHTIDPRTGRPITHRLASVTVLDPSCAYADAMATAFSVMGVEHTLEVANRQGIPVYIIEKTDEGFASRHSKAFEPYLKEQ